MPIFPQFTARHRFKGDLTKYSAPIWFTYCTIFVHTYMRNGEAVNSPVSILSSNIFALEYNLSTSL